MSPARFAALTNKMAAAARPAIAVRRIANTLGVSFSTDGLVMIDMAISPSRWCNGWLNSGRRNDSRHRWPRSFQRTHAKLHWRARSIPVGSHLHTSRAKRNAQRSDLIRVGTRSTGLSDPHVPYSAHGPFAWARGRSK